MRIFPKSIEDNILKLNNRYRNRVYSKDGNEYWVVGSSFDYPTRQYYIHYSKQPEVHILSPGEYKNIKPSDGSIRTISVENFEREFALVL